MSNREIIKTENVLVRIIKPEKDISAEWHFHSEVTDFFAPHCTPDSKQKSLPEKYIG
jgi:hypothetical protein